MTAPPMADGCIGADLVCSKKSLLALSYSILDAARHPPKEVVGHRVTHKKMQIGTVVRQSQGLTALVLRKNPHGADQTF